MTEQLEKISTLRARLCYWLGHCAQHARQTNCPKLVDALGGLQHVIATTPLHELRPSDGQAIRHALGGFAAIFGELELGAGSPKLAELSGALDIAAAAALELGKAIKHVEPPPPARVVRMPERERSGDPGF